MNLTTGNNWEQLGTTCNEQLLQDNAHQPAIGKLVDFIRACHKQRVGYVLESKENYEFKLLTNQTYPYYLCGAIG